jgi:hypothetical protein
MDGYEVGWVKKNQLWPIFKASKICPETEENH